LSSHCQHVVGGDTSITANKYVGVFAFFRHVTGRMSLVTTYRRNVSPKRWIDDMSLAADVTAGNMDLAHQLFYKTLIQIGLSAWFWQISTIGQISCQALIHRRFHEKAVPSSSFPRTRESSFNPTQSVCRALRGGTRWIPAFTGMTNGRTKVTANARHSAPLNA